MGEADLEPGVATLLNRRGVRRIENPRDAEAGKAERQQARRQPTQRLDDAPGICGDKAFAARLRVFVAYAHRFPPSER